MSKRTILGQKGKARSGGGYTSKQVRQVGQRVNPRRLDAINPAAVDMMGQATSFKKPDLVKPVRDFAPMGNALTNNCGPNGEGRTIYPSGYQSQHGTAAKGEKGIEGRADRWPRAILDAPPGNTGRVIRKGEQTGE
jgi:hypothetical protein